MDKIMEQVIYNELRRVSGSRETTTLTLVTDLKTGKSEIDIKKTISKTYKATDHKTAFEDFEAITGGGGRPALTIEDFKP